MNVSWHISIYKTYIWRALSRKLNNFVVTITGNNNFDRAFYTYSLYRAIVLLRNNNFCTAYNRIDFTLLVYFKGFWIRIYCFIEPLFFPRSASHKIGLFLFFKFFF